MIPFEDFHILTPKRGVHNRLQQSLTGRFRKRVYSSPSSGPQEVQLSEEHQTAIAAVLDGVRNGVSRLATQLTSEQSERETLLKPRVTQIALTVARPIIHGAKIDESGDVILFSDEGIQVCEQLSEEEYSFKELKPGQGFEMVSYRDIEANKIFEADLKTILSSYHFDFTFRQKKRWTCPERWTLQEPLPIAESEYSLEPVISGRRTAPKHSLSLSLAPGVSETIFDAGGEKIESLELAVDPNAHAGQTIKVTVKTDLAEHLVFAHIDPDGNLRSVYNQDNKPYKEIQLSDSTRVLSLGNRIITSNGEDYAQFETSTALGEFQGVKEFHDAYYLLYKGVPSGDAALVIDKETLTVRTSEGNNGVISAEAIAFSADGQQMVTVTSEGGKKKTFTITRPPQGLSEGMSLLSNEEKEAITHDATQFLSEEGSALEKSKVLDDLLGKLEEASADKAMKQFFKELSKPYREIKKILRQVQFEEENREKQLKKMKELEEKLYLDIETLPGTQENVGILVNRIGSYVRLRDVFVNDVNDLNLVPESDRNELIERVRNLYDPILENDRGTLINVLFGVDEKLDKHLLKGKSILAEASSAQPPHGHHRVTEKTTEYNSWKKILPVYQKIQQNLDLYFGAYDAIPSTVTGEEKTQREDRNTRIETAKDRFRAAFTKTRTDGVKKTDIEQFTFAHIQAFAADILSEARIINIDPDIENKFARQYDYLLSQIEGLQDKYSEADIAKTAMTVQKGLVELRRVVKDYQNFLKKLENLQKKLSASESKAKELVGKKKERLAEIRKKNIEQDILSLQNEAFISTQYDVREGATPEQMSNEAMRKVTSLFRGFDLSKQSRIERITDAECSDTMLALYAAISKYRKDYPSRTATVETFWQQLREIRSSAIRDVGIEKGFHYKPGYYVLKFPEYFKDLEPQMTDIEFKLSGRDYTGDIKVETDVEWDHDGNPTLKLRVLGTPVVKEMPYILNTVGARDAARVFHWESPLEEEMNTGINEHGKMCIRPKVAREEMATYFLCKEIIENDEMESLKEKLNEWGKSSDEKHMEAYRGEIEEELRVALTSPAGGIVSQKFMRLEDKHIEDTITMVFTLWKDMNITTNTFTEALAAEGSETERPLEGLSSQHPILTQESNSISWKSLFKRTQAFEKKYAKGLLKMHTYIQRNEDRFSDRFQVEEFNKRNKLVADYRPTIHDFIRLKTLNDRKETIKNSPGKNVIFFYGAPGSGKTTLLLALSKYSRNCMMMLQGNNLHDAVSLDPQEAKTPTHKRILTQLQAGLMGLAGGDTVVIDEAPKTFHLMNEAYQVLDARRSLTNTLEDIPDPKTSLDIDIFTHGTNIYPKGEVFWIWIGNKIAELSQAIDNRIEKIDDDKLCRDHPEAWIISYLEKNSADLGIHPEDVKWIAYKRLVYGNKKLPQDIDWKDPQLQTEFHDSQEFEELVKTIDNRLMASQWVTEMQMAQWDTYEYRKRPYALGKLPLDLFVGARDLPRMMAQINHELDKPSDVGRAVYHFAKEKDGTPDDYLAIADIIGCYDDFSPEDIEKAKQEAIDRKIIGEAPNATVASLKLITNRLDTLNGKVQSFLDAPNEFASTQATFNTNIQGVIADLSKHITTINQTAPQQSEAMMSALERMMKMMHSIETGSKEERSTQLEAFSTQLSQFKEMVGYVGKLAEAAVILPGGKIEKPEFESQKVTGAEMTFEDDEDELG